MRRYIEQSREIEIENCIVSYSGLIMNFTKVLYIEEKRWIERLSRVE